MDAPRHRLSEEFMPFRLRLLLTLTLLGLASSRALAHYNMLLPAKASVKKGEAVTLTYLWGHPFEHQLFDAPTPERLLVVAPDGKVTDLTAAVQKATVPGQMGKTVAAFHLRFTPEQRGDYVFVLSSPPIWMEENQEFYQDTVTVVLHVQAQKGWDAPTAAEFVLRPLTRPYGLQPGMVFQAQALWGGKPLGDALVEIEHYNPTPPQELPPDEHITRTARTDPSGVATGTLTEAGWWCLTAQRDGGQKQRDGKAYPVRRRATLWVYVDEKVMPGAKQ
jgi:cobalt/nickel transport protein